MSAATVAVIGAGYAGLACAVELARRGVHVTVFERSHTLGGRARVVRKDDWVVDNGQHILIGAYRELTRLLRLTGGTPRQLAHLPLTLHVPGRLELRAAPWLPAPLHLAWGILRARGLGWGERLAMLRLMRGLKKSGFKVAPGTTVETLLHQYRQPRALRELIWEPLCIAALNTPVQEACAQVFANVLRDSLAADAAASELLIPRADLSELFPVAAARYLATRHGRLHTGNAIQTIRPTPEGYLLEGDPAGKPWRQVVLATAPYHAAALLASTGGCERLAKRLDELPHEPIVTVYLALGAGQQLPESMIGLAQGPAQWAFDRGRLGGPEGLIACVISAHSPHEALPRDELILAVHAQLEQELGLRLPAPVWSQVIVEKRATIACRPGVFRPGIRTPLPGLWLAGDYIESDYPATLESAVRSGVACAEAIWTQLERGS